MRTEVIASATLTLLSLIGIATKINAAQPETLGRIEHLDTRFDQLVKRDTKIEVLAKGLLGRKDRFGWEVQTRGICFFLTSLETRSFNGLRLSEFRHS